MIHTTKNAEETKQIAASFAATLRGGETVLLQGDLGAGKTTFVQGLVEALGGEAAHSPTFSIMNVYETGQGTGDKGQGVERVVHLDLYRLKHPDEIRELGLEEWLGKKNVVVLVEWPEAVPGLNWPHATRVRMEVVSETERRVEIVG